MSLYVRLMEYDAKCKLESFKEEFNKSIEVKIVVDVYDSTDSRHKPLPVTFVQSETLASKNISFTPYGEMTINTKMTEASDLVDFSIPFYLNGALYDCHVGAATLFSMTLGQIGQNLGEATEVS